MVAPICTMHCDDCGKFAIFDNDGITIFKVNDEYYAVSVCSFCHGIVVDADITEKVISYLSQFDIKLFDWNTGQKIKTEETND